jgi:hypothetical protein
MRPISIIVRSMKQPQPRPDAIAELKRKVHKLTAQVKALETREISTGKTISDIIASHQAFLRSVEALKDIANDHRIALDRLFEMHADAPHESTERLH